ncbi:hypothetical protein HDV05_000892 [Chytridiales sp. JEL 0842]|nr:hypothetical protein HDV05_000892 [Chytridiales sp. JEL 0842]
MEQNQRDKENEERLRNVFSADVLQFENMVMENQDEVMVEARKLLNQWIENTASTSDDDASNLLDFNSNPLRPNPSSKRIRDPIHDLITSTVQDSIMSSTSKDSSHFAKVKDPQLLMSARQALARQRRQEQERQRRLEIENKIREKQERLKTEEKVEERRRKDVVGKWEVEVGVKMLRMEVEDMKRGIMEIRPHILSSKVDLTKSREECVEEKVTTTVAEPKPPIEEEHIPQKRTSKPRPSPASLLKAEELYQFHRLRTLRPIFSTWVQLQTQTQLRLQSFCKLRAWKTTSSLFLRWTSNKSKRECKREAERIEKELKRDRDSNLKAERHFKKTLVSKVFLGWWGWAKMEAEEKILRRQHQERSKRIREFISNLEAQVVKPKSALEPIPLRNGSAVSEEQLQIVEPLPLQIPPVELIHVAPAAEPHIEPPTPVASTESHPLPNEAEQEPAPPPSTHIHVPFPRPPTPKVNKPLRSLKDQKLIDQMESRARKLKELKESRAQRLRERQEAQRIQALEEEKREQERVEEEKRKVLEAKKELVRKKLEEEERKKAERERMKRLIEFAGQADKRRLMRKYVMGPLKVLRELRRQERVEAERFEERWNLKASLLVWRRRVEMKQSVREEKALEVWQTKTEIRVLDVWKRKMDIIKQAEIQAYSKWCHQTKKKVLDGWRTFTTESIYNRMQAERAKERKADEFARTYVPKRFLRKWKAIINEIKDERWREFRKEQLRGRAKELLSNSRFEEKLKSTTLSMFT